MLKDHIGAQYDRLGEQASRESSANQPISNLGEGAKKCPRCVGHHMQDEDWLLLPVSKDCKMQYIGHP